MVIIFKLEMEAIMIDFKYINERFIVKCNSRMSSEKLQFWNKKDFQKDYKFDKNWVTVKKAIEIAKKHNCHFSPAGYFIETYIVSFLINSTFGNCNDSRAALYFVGKKLNIKWLPVDSIENITDTTVEIVNRERRLVNYMLGKSDESEILDSDSFYGTKQGLINTLHQCLKDFETFA